MKVNKFVLSLLAGFVMVFGLGTYASLKEKTIDTSNPLCVSEFCVGTLNDHINVDPVTAKHKNRGVDNHQDILSVFVPALGEIRKSVSYFQLNSIKLHILFRQLLL